MHHSSLKDADLATLMLLWPEEALSPTPIPLTSHTQKGMVSTTGAEGENITTIPPLV